MELADKGLKTADIAKEMNVAYKEVQALRRSAASTLRDVEERIAKRVDAQNDATNRREAGRHLPKTVGGPRVRQASDSIVEPYRETVIAMVKAGGNHRTIHPVIREMGYTGSCNAIYQYILKLRKEKPEQLHPEWIEKPPELTLESYTRDKLYSAILKEASKERPGKEEASKQSPPSKAKNNPVAANDSPFSDKATKLILGPEKEADEPKENAKKKTFDLKKAIEIYPIVAVLTQFLKDLYHVFDSRDIKALDGFIHTYSTSEVDTLAQYAKGLADDYEAVKNSLIYADISNGPLEGVNSRIKAIHRRSSGRAGIFLLNAYMVLSEKA